MRFINKAINSWCVPLKSCCQHGTISEPRPPWLVTFIWAVTTGDVLQEPIRRVESFRKLWLGAMSHISVPFVPMDYENDKREYWADGLIEAAEQILRG